MEETNKQKRIYKIVLTGGPCGGKTTGQSRICTFFENLGWKVFRSPEVATVLFKGGIKFSTLSSEESYKFQENMIRCTIKIEKTYFDLAESFAMTHNCLIVCDRGVMDASAYIDLEKWEKMKQENKWDEKEFHDRYDHVVHMVSAAVGAEDFYTIEDHETRTEDVSLARAVDERCASAWIEHPHFDVIDNSTDFNTKLNRLIECICQTLGIDTGDYLSKTSKKHKFLVSGPLPDKFEFPSFHSFNVVQHYLQSIGQRFQTWKVR